MFLCIWLKSLLETPPSHISHLSHLSFTWCRFSSSFPPRWLCGSSPRQTRYCWYPLRRWCDSKCLCSRCSCRQGTCRWSTVFHSRKIPAFPWSPGNLGRHRCSLDWFFPGTNPARSFREAHSLVSRWAHPFFLCVPRLTFLLRKSIMLVSAKYSLLIIVWKSSMASTIRFLLCHYRRDNFICRNRVMLRC